VETKAELRARLRARRDAEPERDARSRRILERAIELPQYRAARVIASFVGVNSEVNTAPLLERALADGKRVAVPWRDGVELRFTALDDLGDLVPASFGLREPAEPLRVDAGREIAPEAIDLVLVPGLGFDRLGNRLGHGRGYYDRFLRRCRRETPRVGLAFECQVVDQLPVTDRDEPLDLLVTESGVYRFTRRTTSAAR
jgi:5-formyltetrahydrofolate cyclo-ligase